VSTISESIGPIGTFFFIEFKVKRIIDKHCIADALKRYSRPTSARHPSQSANGALGMAPGRTYGTGTQPLSTSSPPVQTNGRSSSGPTSPVSLKRKTPPRTPTPNQEVSSDVAVASPHIVGDNLAQRPSPTKRANYGGDPQVEKSLAGRNGRGRARVS
jgi:hypothetical protein